jgi:hypothetical protein
VGKVIWTETSTRQKEDNVPPKSRQERWPCRRWPTATGIHFFYAAFQKFRLSRPEQSTAGETGISNSPSRPKGRSETSGGRKSSSHFVCAAHNTTSLSSPFRLLRIPYTPVERVVWTRTCGTLRAFCRRSCSCSASSSPSHWPLMSAAELAVSPFHSL